MSQPKTDLIQGFISKKGRPFDAYLVRSGAKFSWEFPPRKPRVGKDGKTIERKAKTPPDLSKAQPLILQRGAHGNNRKPSRFSRFLPGSGAAPLRLSQGCGTRPHVEIWLDACFCFIDCV